MSIPLPWNLFPHYVRAVLARIDLTAWLGIAMLLGAGGVGVASWAVEREVQALAQHTVELRRRFENLAASQLSMERRAPSLPDYYAGFPGCFV